MAKDIEYLSCPDSWRYWRCADCATVFLPDPPVGRLHEIYPPTYYTHQDQDVGWVQRVKERLDDRLFKRLLARIPGENLVIADIGGGTGWLLSRLRHLSPRIAESHVVDFDSSCREAAETAGHVFHAVRAESFDPPRSFDLILLLNLIEHVAEPRAVLTRLASSLKPGGLLLLKTPNTDTLDCRLFRQRNWGGFHCPRHWVLFTKQSLLALAADCGLVCVDFSYTQGAPQWVPSVLGLLSARGWIQVSRERPMYRHPLFAPLAAIAAAFDFLRSPFMPTAQMVALFARR